MELTNLWYGYPTIAIDRLGNGNSSHPDPITTVQMSLQVATIHKIITELRQGTIKGPSKNRSFKKVIFTAHSYGSICGNAIASEYPKDVDAFVLTGYTGDFEGAPGPFSVGIPQPAATAMPARYAGYALGYLVQTLLTGRNFSLHTTPRYGDFDRAVAEYDFDNEGTISVGELATLVIRSQFHPQVHLANNAKVLRPGPSRRIHRTCLRRDRPARPRGVQHTRKPALR